MSANRRPRILLGVTGSVAAVKAPEIAVLLHRVLHANVKIVLTQGGANFWNCAQEYNPAVWAEFSKLLLHDINGGEKDETLIQVHYSEEEWRNWMELGDPVMHIDLRDWADVMVVAPLSAHTLAKVANGLCDDVLTSVLRAWDFGHGMRPAKPIVVAPAMNTAMWLHPLTKQQLDTFAHFYRHGNEQTKNTMLHVVSPQVKELACGEVGDGALAAVENVISAVETVCSQNNLYIG